MNRWRQLLDDWTDDIFTTPWSTDGRRQARFEAWTQSAREYETLRKEHEMTIQDTLNERQKTHGNFGTHADICQALKRVMYQTPSWYELSAPQKEALDMIQHKVARILNGNPGEQDHWRDIAGYAELERQTLEYEEAHI